MQLLSDGLGIRKKQVKGLNKDLKVLLVEDSEVDAELIFSNLSEAGIRKETGH